MKAKLIEYAYPSSETATKAGYGNSGCWFVVLYPDVNAFTTREQPVLFTSDKQAAIDHANTMPEPFNWMHQYFTI